MTCRSMSLSPRGAEETTCIAITGKRPRPAIGATAMGTAGMGVMAASDAPLLPPPGGFVRLDATDRCCGQSQRVADACATGKYSALWRGEDAELSKQAELIGEKVFLPICKREMLPAKPYEGATRRFLVDTGHVLGFQGRAGKDLSKLYHLLLMPSIELLQASCGARAAANGVPLRWLFDLKPQHQRLLVELRTAGLAFLEVNRKWLERQYDGTPPQQQQQQSLKGQPLSYWLRHENVQFGFHVNPSVGFLHLHMLVGPLTDFGFEDKYRHNWVSLESVLQVLAAGRPASDLLPEHLGAPALQAPTAAFVAQREGLAQPAR